MCCEHIIPCTNTHRQTHIHILLEKEQDWRLANKRTLYKKNEDWWRRGAPWTRSKPNLTYYTIHKPCEDRHPTHKHPQANTHSHTGRKWLKGLKTGDNSSAERGGAYPVWRLVKKRSPTSKKQPITYYTIYQPREHMHPITNIHRQTHTHILLDKEEDWWRRGHYRRRMKTGEGEERRLVKKRSPMDKKQTKLNLLYNIQTLWTHASHTQTSTGKHTFTYW